MHSSNSKPLFSHGRATAVAATQCFSLLFFRAFVSRCLFSVYEMNCIRIA